MPSELADIGLDETEDGSHGGGFASPIGTQKPQQSTAFGIQPKTIQRNDVAKAFGQAGDVQHSIKR